MLPTRSKVVFSEQSKNRGARCQTQPSKDQILGAGFLGTNQTNSRTPLNKIEQKKKRKNKREEIRKTYPKKTATTEPKRGRPVNEKTTERYPNSAIYRGREGHFGRIFVASSAAVHCFVGGHFGHIITAAVWVGVVGGE